MTVGYVANWGNDNNDGLSWGTAKKSIQSAIDSGFNPINAKGFFNEKIPSIGSIIGHGVIFSSMSLEYLFGGHYDILENITFQNIYQFNGNSIGVNTNFTNSCIFINCSNLGDLSGRGLRRMSNSIIYKSHNVGILYNLLNNNTLHSCTINRIGYEFAYFMPKNNIFSDCSINVEIDLFKFINFSLFINSQFKFTGGGLGTDETAFSYPTGATDAEKLDNIRNRMAVVYGGVAADYLIGCKYYSGSYNDIFVDADAGNFYLKNDPSNPALHVGYEGKWIGARPPAAASFAVQDTTTKTNIDAAGNIIDQSQNAQAEWNNIINLGKVLKIAKLEALANLAYRNGLSLNTDAYVSADIAAGSNVLTSGKQYQVIDAAATGGTILINDSGSTVFSAFDTFTAVDEGSGSGLGFSSVDGLTVREIDITKFDEKIEVVSSITDSTLLSANTIHLLVHEEPKVNADANGEPLLGNGDAGFDPVTAVSWKVRYLKIKAVVKANQLYAR